MKSFPEKAMEVGVSRTPPERKLDEVEKKEEKNQAGTNEDNYASE